MICFAVFHYYNQGCAVDTPFISAADPRGAWEEGSPGFGWRLLFKLKDPFLQFVSNQASFSPAQARYQEQVHRTECLHDTVVFQFVRGRWVTYKLPVYC